MQRRVLLWTLTIVIILLVGLWLSFFTTVPGKTWIELKDKLTGRVIVSEILTDGETITLQWKNSLFHLFVTETYVAEKGFLIQRSIIFADPQGKEPPLVRREDVDDLYHTGGAFKVEGLSRTFQRIDFRVGTIGNPVLKIRNDSIYLAHEVGFGGAAILEARIPNRYKVWFK